MPTKTEYGISVFVTFVICVAVASATRIRFDDSVPAANREREMVAIPTARISVQPDDDNALTDFAQHEEFAATSRRQAERPVLAPENTRNRQGGQPAKSEAGAPSPSVEEDTVDDLSDLETSEHTGAVDAKKIEGTVWVPRVVADISAAEMEWLVRSGFAEYVLELENVNWFHLTGTLSAPRTLRRMREQISPFSFPVPSESTDAVRRLVTGQLYEFDVAQMRCWCVLDSAFAREILEVQRQFAREKRINLESIASMSIEFKYFKSRRPAIRIVGYRRR